MDNLKKKEVMVKDQFGICYKCGNPMVMLSSTYLLYTVTPHGKYASRLLGKDNDITFFCVKCGTRMSMINTVDGLYPKDYFTVTDKERETANRQHNIIGYVE